MLKSIYKFRLFLMISLIMLVATAVSIGNMNLFLNAMAIEMNPLQVVVDYNTQLVANNQVDKANSMSDISPSNVLDVIPPQQAKTSQQNPNSKGPPGLADQIQIPSTKIYRNFGDAVFTSPAHSPEGFATSFATCNPGDTAISGQPFISGSWRNVFPGTGDLPENIAGSYMSGFDSFSVNSNTGWVVNAYGNNLLVQAAVTCFDN